MTTRENSPPNNISDNFPNEQGGKGLNPARCVTVELAALVTGYTEAAIRQKIVRGVWLEGRQWVKRDGRVLIDLTGVERWHLTGNP